MLLNDVVGAALVADLIDLIGFGGNLDCLLGGGHGVPPLRIKVLTLLSQFKQLCEVILPN